MNRTCSFLLTAALASIAAPGAADDLWSIDVCREGLARELAHQLPLDVGPLEGAAVEVIQRCEEPTVAEIAVEAGGRTRTVSHTLEIPDDHLEARAIAFIVRAQLDALTSAPPMMPSMRSAARTSEETPRDSRTRAAATRLTLSADASAYPLSPSVSVGPRFDLRHDWFELGVDVPLSVLLVPDVSVHVLSILVSMGAGVSVPLRSVELRISGRAEGGTLWVAPSSAGTFAPSVGARAELALLVPLDDNVEMELGVEIGYRLGVVLVLDGVERLRIDGLRFGLHAGVSFDL